MSDYRVRVDYRDCELLVAQLQNTGFSPGDAIATLIGAAAFAMGVQSVRVRTRDELLESLKDFLPIVEKAIELGRGVRLSGKWVTPS